MEEDPDSISSNGVKGWYKGRFFRSSYEYFFMRKLESMGVSLHDVELEPFHIPYSFEGEEHSYVPDFFVPALGTVFEVKDIADLDDARVKAKAAAATKFLNERALKYELVTSSDLDIPRCKSIREKLTEDPCVFLSPKSDDVIDLRFMFEKQVEFMNILREKRDHPDFPVDMTTKVGQRCVKDIAHECMHELFEAIHLLKDAKKHRRTVVGNFDRDAFLEELADTLHYYVGLCALADVSADELYRAYMKKGTINVARIDDGY